MSRSTCIIALFLAAATPAAAQTMGLEWELRTEDVTVVAYGPDGKPIKVKHASPTKRLLCTDATVTVDGETHPLVAVTYDNGGTTRVLELVTAPLPYDQPDAWTPVAAEVTRFFRALDAACNRQACEAREDVVHGNLEGWNRCGRTGTGAVTFDVKGPSADFGLADSEPQTNLAVPLTAVLDDAFPYLPAPVHGAPDPLSAREMRRRIRLAAEVQAPAMTPAARAFVTWYFLALNVEGMARTQLLVGKNAWQRKNLFDVFLKAPLPGVFARLTAPEQLAVRDLLRALSPIAPPERPPSDDDDLVVSDDDDDSNSVVINDGSESDDDGPLPPPPPPDRRAAFCAVPSAPHCAPTAWAKRLARGRHRIIAGIDPFDMASITNPIAPVLRDGSIEVVVELRRPAHAINKALCLAWQDKAIAIPGLTIAAEHIAPLYQ